MSDTVPSQPPRPGATDWTALAQQAARQNARAAFPCRVCGAQMAGGATECAVCGTPPNMTVNPYDSTASTYFPAGYAAPARTPGQVADPIEITRSRAGKP